MMMSYQNILFASIGLNICESLFVLASDSPTEQWTANNLEYALLISFANCSFSLHWYVFPALVTSGVALVVRAVPTQRRSPKSFILYLPVSQKPPSTDLSFYTSCIKI